MNNKRNVGFEIHALSNLMKRSAEWPCMRHWQQNTELTVMQSRVVGYIYRNEERDVFQKDIEQEFSIRRPTVSILLQTMEKKGLITRESVPQDARLKKVALTDTAREQAEAISRKINATEKKLVAGISDEDMACFYRVLDAIRANLIKEENLNATTAAGKGKHD